MKTTGIVQRVDLTSTTAHDRLIKISAEITIGRFLYPVRLVYLLAK
jgi:hypothetical protein